VITLTHLIAGCCIAAIASPAFAAGDVRLIQAVRARDAAAVRALIARRVDVNAPQADGATALHWAAHVDDLAIADLLIRAGGRADVGNDNGFTPLHLACTNRSGSMVQRLLAAGGGANAKTPNGETVLMTCSRAGDQASVKALLMKGARVNDTELAHDQTALMWQPRSATRMSSSCCWKAEQTSRLARARIHRSSSASRPSASVGKS